MAGTFEVNLNEYGIPLDNSQWSSDLKEIFEWNYKNAADETSESESESDYEFDINPAKVMIPCPSSSLEFLQTILNSLDTFTFHPLPSYKSGGKTKAGDLQVPPLDIRHTSGRSLFKVVSFHQPEPEPDPVSEPAPNFDFKSDSESNSASKFECSAPHWSSCPPLNFAVVDSLGRILLRIEPIEDYEKWPGQQLFLRSSQGPAGHILCSDPTLRNFRYGVRRRPGERVAIIADGRLVACHCCWWCPFSPPGIEFVANLEPEQAMSGRGDGIISGAGRNCVGKMNRIEGELKLEVCEELHFMHKLWLIVICWHAAGVQPWL